MAEPRKPRVIRTRPGTPKPPTVQPDAGALPAASGKPLPRVSVSAIPAHEPAAAVEDSRKAGRFSAKMPGLAFARAKKAGDAAPAAAKPATGKATAARSASEKEATGEQDAQVLAFPVPEYKRRRKLFLLAAAGVCAVVALVMVLALYSPALAVKTVTFTGTKLVSAETLQHAMAPVMNKPLPQVTDGEVQALLASVIQVKSSRIEALPPSTLVVHIVERVPVALLKNDQEYLLVDQEGVQLGVTNDPASIALPLIDGGKAAIGQDTFQAMTAVLANLPQSILEQLANATAKSPDAVELKLADGRSVIWGNADEMELKAEVLEALLSAPPPTAEAGKPVPAPAQVFDVSAPRHPVTR